MIQAICDLKVSFCFLSKWSLLVISFYLHMRENKTKISSGRQNFFVSKQSRPCFDEFWERIFLSFFHFNLLLLNISWLCFAVVRCHLDERVRRKRERALDHPS